MLLGAGPAHMQVLRQWAQQPLAGAEALCLLPAITPELDAWAKAARVHLVEGQPTALDAAARRVQLGDGRSAEYELLSLDPVPATSRDALPGARGQALFAQPEAALQQLLPGLLALAERRVIDVVVIGGGVIACELALALQRQLSAGGEERARVALVLGGERPLWAQPAWPAAAVARLEAWLTAQRITLFREAASAVEPGAVRLASGARLACDAPIVATDPAPPPWLAGSGLALDEDGWVARSITLQSVSHPEVLVAGEGGAAVGAVLAINLQRLAGGGELQAGRPPPRRAVWLDAGDGRALFARGCWWAGGRLAGWCRQRLIPSA